MSEEHREGVAGGELELPLSSIGSFQCGAGSNPYGIEHFAIVGDGIPGGGGDEEAGIEPARRAQRGDPVCDVLEGVGIQSFARGHKGFEEAGPLERLIDIRSWAHQHPGLLEEFSQGGGSPWKLFGVSRPCHRVAGQVTAIDFIHSPAREHVSTAHEDGFAVATDHQHLHALGPILSQDDGGGRSDRYRGGCGDSHKSNIGASVGCDHGLSSSIGGLPGDVSRHRISAALAASRGGTPCHRCQPHDR